jgi:hypothetical protein
MWFLIIECSLMAKKLKLKIKKVRKKKRKERKKKKKKKIEFVKRGRAPPTPHT